MSETFALTALIIFVPAFLIFLAAVFFMWHWHSKNVMRKPTCTDAEMASLFAPRPVVPKPEGYKTISDEGTLSGVLRRLTGMR